MCYTDIIADSDHTFTGLPVMDSRSDIEAIAAMESLAVCDRGNKFEGTVGNK